MLLSLGRGRRVQGRADGLRTAGGMVLVLLLLYAASLSFAVY